MLAELAISLPDTLNAPVVQERQEISDAALQVLRAIMGGCWAMAYILIIRHSYADKYLGIPLVALGFNAAWEFTFAFVYPHPPGQRVVDIVWFFIDLVILYAAIRYGRKDYPSLSPRVYPWVLVGMFSFTVTFTIFTTYELSDDNGRYVGFGIDALMTYLFVLMLRRRNSTAGQSLYIAVFKTIGTIAASVLFVLWYPDSLLLPLFFATSLFFNVFYIVLLYRKFQEEGLRPWSKFWGPGRPYASDAELSLDRSTRPAASR